MLKSASFSAREDHKNKWKAFFVLAVLLLLPAGTKAQTWNWKIETVDQSGIFTSLVADRLGNVHISYVNRKQGVKYGFRPAGSSQWFTMNLGKAEDGYTHLALDSQGNPNLCYTAYEKLTYGRFQDGKWAIQDVSPGSGLISFSCSVAVGPDGTPHLVWYQYYDRERSLYLHLKYAALKDGVWMARTVDFDGETGKWNSMALDAQGNPRIAYSAFRKGDLKYAFWNGKGWVVTTVDSRTYGKTEGVRGLGNSLALSPDGAAQVSYFEDLLLKFARQQGATWKIEVVDSLSPLVGVGWLGLWSSLVLDSYGGPHIIYGDYGALKHAYRDGKEWRVQVIESGGPGQYKFTSAAIDPNDTLFVSYQDPTDDSLRVAVGRVAPRPQTAETAKKKQD